MEVLAGSEIDSMFLKGFANGNNFYLDPVLRQQGDLDFLLPSARSGILSEHDSGNIAEACTALVGKIIPDRVRRFRRLFPVDPYLLPILWWE